MPLIVPLEPIPNQSATIRLDARRYEITVKEMNGVMGVTLVRDGELLVSNLRAVAGFPLLPYEHLARDAGNFIFTNTDEGAIPYYVDFGSKCFLVYSTAAEIAEAAVSE